MTRVINLSLFIFLLAYAGNISLLSTSSGTVTSISGIINELEASDLIFIGELHDEPFHHRVQFEIIRELHERGAKIGIGLEMFRADNQKFLDKWISGEMPVEEFKKVYTDNWSIPWPLYDDIFLYAREHGIPMAGLNVPPEIVKQVAREGFSSLSPEQLERMPGVSCVIDRKYEEFIRQAFGEHHMDGKSFDHFCEAQMVWDTGMASNAVRFLNRHQDHIMVVLAGGGHAWKYGIPEQVKRKSSGFRSVVILPESERLSREEVTTSQADYLYFDSS